MLFRVSDLIEPWDLQIEIEGKIYDTRPLVLADVEKIKQLPSLGPDKHFEFISSFFRGEKPPLTGDAVEISAAVVGVISKYAAARSEKNSRAIATKIAVAMASPSTSGESRTA